MRVLMALGLLALTHVAEAGVFRCREIGGGPIYYQNQPCPGGTFQRALRQDLPPPPEFFAVPRNVEVVARPPVRVVPLANVAHPERLPAD